jgi:hypothetical protein
MVGPDSTSEGPYPAARIDDGQDYLHDAAAAHALMREIANLREVARKRGSSSGQLALNLLDVMERSADERMAEWGYNE